MRGNFIGRSRWAAIGAAVAVSLGAGGVFWTSAASPESSVVAIDPVRIMDTRNPTNLGLDGPFVSATGQDLQVTGAIDTLAGTATVVPAGATGVFLNVTPVNATADGFISVRPATATGMPETSNVNFVAGAINPNAVLVELPVGGTDDGVIEITFDAFGQVGPTSDILVDVFGYMTDAEMNSAAAAHESGEQALVLTDADQVARTVSLTPPADGTIIVNSSASTIGISVPDATVRCSITTGTTIDGTHLQSTHVEDLLTANLSGTRGFDVTGGAPFTANLVCDVSLAGDSASLLDSALTAVFAPS